MTLNTTTSLTVGDETYTIYPIAEIPGTHRLPYSVRVLLENAVRTGQEVQPFTQWNPAAEPSDEIQFTPGRVIMQDFTGVPCVVDLAAMREAVAELGGDPEVINPLSPAQLVIDHSVIADVFGRQDAFARNVELEYQRNHERYQLLRWAQQAFSNFRVVPPGTGIVHQVNIEYLAPVVMTRDGVAYPDTCVGTDSHTTMVNGLGVLGWGVGGIEAEAAMLGQPVSMLLPNVLGFRLYGELPAGATATDLVLTVTEMLREHGVVGKFVEFYGEGVGAVPLATRATLGNMSPEFGSTVAIFPPDEETLRYMRLTGRSKQQVQLTEAYMKEQGLWHDPTHTPEFSAHLELDLSTVEPSIAGPKRPQDRIRLADAQRAFRCVIGSYIDDLPTTALEGADEASEESFPASDSPAVDHDTLTDRPAAKDEACVVSSAPHPHTPVPVTLSDGREMAIDHGSVVIAAITSCTNTSNPEVMIGAALLARNAVQRGLRSAPWVKTTLAPGSQVVTNYFDEAGLTPYLEKLGFHLVGYGCTTCIGNSGPLPEEISRAVSENELAVAGVLSGNRNFEGRINPDVKLNYLASPPLVIAYALAGSVDVDLTREPLGSDEHGEPVYLADIWPSPDEVQSIIGSTISAEMYQEDYQDVFTGDERWRTLPTPETHTFVWEEDSTYVRKPPFFKELGTEPAPLRQIAGARVLVKLGDSVTTDHISPAGAIKLSSPAGAYLRSHGVPFAEFNSYGSRRGNHEVMIRGTFANIRLRNQLLPGSEGGVTRNFLSGEEATIFDAAEAYREADVPLIALAGKEYGSGSSRDWAAKGTALLGVRAVIAVSFERIHRSNLIGMGVLPLEFLPGESADVLKLDGSETFTIEGIEQLSNTIPDTLQVRAVSENNKVSEFQVRVRIDTPREAEYYRHGGILPYVLRTLADEE